MEIYTFQKTHFSALCFILTSKVILKTDTYPYRNIAYQRNYSFFKFELSSDLHPQSQFFSFIATKFPDHTLIFTDASKTSERCAVAIFNIGNKDVRQVELFPDSDILEAEQTAIFLALHYCIQIILPYHSKILIVFDSLSAVKAICPSPFKRNSNQIILHIRNLLQHISLTRHTCVSFLWTLGTQSPRYNRK
jgi:hypothetical protein